MKKTTQYCRSTDYDFSTHGFSLIQVMITMTIMSIVSLAIISLMNQMQDFRAREGHLARLEELKRNIISIIRDDPSWSETVKLVINREMHCLRKSKDCQKILGLNPAPLIKNLKDASGRLIVDADDRLHEFGGFTFDGQLCKGFDIEDGNDLCPLRYEIRWMPVCMKDKPCFFSSLRITGRLFYSLHSKDEEIMFNKGRFSFEVIRPPGASFQVQQLACLAGGGQWSNGSCVNNFSAPDEKKQKESCPSQSVSYKSHSFQLPSFPSGKLYAGPPIMADGIIISTGTYRCNAGSWNTVTAPSELSLDDLGSILKEGLGKGSF